MFNKSICVTAGEQSESHHGMNISGDGLRSEGYNIQELLKIKNKLTNIGIESEFYRLDTLQSNRNIDYQESGLLIIRNFVDYVINDSADNLFKELIDLKWDTMYWDSRRQKVLNKQARYNLCFENYSQNPDYENKKGTIISFEDAPLLKKWNESLNLFFGSKSENLKLEGNFYYDINKCGIGFHGDCERKIVIACCLGASRPIEWRWFYQSKFIGDKMTFNLNHGDMYIMSQKTTGYDWKKKNITTLRHASGKKYIC